jgi:hypothetical protein
MKVVDKRLIFVSSKDRVQGAINDFVIELPPHLLKSEKPQFTRMILNDAVIPYTWYNVQASNQTLMVREELLEYGAVVSTRSQTITLDSGSYNVNGLVKLLLEKLNDSENALLDTYTLAYNQNTGKLTLGSDFASYPSSGPLTVNDGYRVVLTFQDDATHKLLGGTRAGSHVLNGPVGLETSSANTLTLPQTVNMMFTEALLLHTSIPNTNIYKGAGERTTFHVSNAFAKVAVNTSPFNNIIFTNQNDDFMLNTPDDNINTVRFSLHTMEHDPIILNDEYSFTLKLEVLEDDEKDIKDMNAHSTDLLKTLILQQHVYNQKTNTEEGQMTRGDN